jgi:glycosyltransferase involved in cell wall biosynthesis
MKVVWLCNFANQGIKEHFKMPQFNEFAPWIDILIELFKTQPDVDLHIVAPNVFNNTDCSFKKDGINYHFYKRIPIPYNNKYVRKIHTFLKVEQITNFFWIKYKVANCIHKINPDIIHLHGAENPYYSAGILPLFGKYPILTTIQGFIRNSSDISYNVKKAIEIEEAIIKKSKHIGIRTDDMSEIALKINPEATLHYHFYPLSIPPLVKNNIGKAEPIDCVFFANVTKDKGIEDLLSAISIVKKMFPDISLSVIGSTKNKYLAYLKKVCSELNIEKNVTFLGFLPTQEDIYKYTLQAKMCVMPTYHDIIPGTIIENINQLAEKIIQLLNNADSRKRLAEKAYTNAYELVNNNKVITDMLKAYKSIIKENIII